MYENIIGSRAEKIEYHYAFTTDGQIDKLSFTPFVQKDLLDEVISTKLYESEKQVDLKIKDLNDLKELVSMTPSSFSEKDVYESRLKSLFNLHFISIEIKDLDINENISSDEKIQKINELDALLQVSNHGPLRNLLEEKIKTVKNTIQEIQKDSINMENLVMFINNAKSPDEINEIFCEVFIEEYVNLERKGRDIVANEFWKQSKGYQSNKNIMNDLKKIIINFSKQSQYVISSDIKEENYLLVQEEMHKDTLDINEIARILE